MDSQPSNMLRGSEVCSRRASGTNPQVVKRLFMSVGKSVVRLERLSVGQLSLEDCGLCAPGDFAELSQQQIDRLWQDPAPVQPKKGTESQSEV
ncbi:unnamed protein product [Cladocopium goreaui]|uniref:Ribosomal large subunit pseudouridine synthase B n=1 Tax=Cladocopium goreaui TaxID=2562237 RepID=A0A9P1D5C1_9DINO|nr:unnamed protein product [Cladocopium goreaui]